MKTKFLAALLFGVIGTWPLAEAQTFQRVFGSTLEERSEWVTTTSDGGYAISGWRNLGGIGHAYVLKLDASGALQWDWLIGNTGFDVANRVEQTSDGGYVLAGETSSSSGGFGIALWKLDSTGLVQWARAYPGSPFVGGSGGGTAVEEVSTGGYILAGRMQLLPDASEAPVLIRVGPGGNIIWAYYYYNPDPAFDTFASFFDVHETLDGGFVACGYISNSVVGEQQTLMVKTDNLGNVLWANLYGIAGYDDCAYGVDPAANGDYILTGYTKAVGEGGGTFLLRTDGAGNLLWYRTFRYFHSNNSMLETPTGDIILAGNVDDFSGTSGASLLQTDGTGAFQWCWVYGGAAQEYGEAVRPVPAGGYKFVAWTDSFGAGMFDIYSIRTDAAGSSGCNESPFTPLLNTDQPPVIPVELLPRPLQEFEQLPYEQFPADTVQEVLCEEGGQPPCPDLELSLGTGVADDGSLIPIGDPDDDWTVTAEPPPTGSLPRPATVVDSYPGWLTIPGTRWVSANYIGPNGEYIYEFCFCLDEGFQNPLLSLDLRADDWAEVYLNGFYLGATPNPSFNTPTPSHFEATNPAFFQPGENCIMVVVYNSAAVVTGLNASGSVFAERGECCDGCVQAPSGMVAWWPLDEPTGAPFAQEIIHHNHGSYVNGATPGVPGMVQNAVDFDGVNDLITAPNHPTLNFPPAPYGDFTIDAWVYLDTFSVLYAPIVHKRDANGIGYYFFLLDGQPALYLGDGGTAPGFTIYCCNTTALSPGQWYHLAVTVDRDHPAGIQYYVNGAPWGTPWDPTDRPGDLTNGHELLIGAADYEDFPTTPPSYWDGRIDEVEIFNRALDASEIQAIYEAGTAGKCKETCHAPWDKRFCRFQNTVTTGITICNYDVVDHDYQLTFTGLPSGSLPGCSIDGPTSFTLLGSNPVTVPAGLCVTVLVQIDRPAGMTAAFQIGCYEVQIDNLDTGNTMLCHGSVVDRRDLCTVFIPIDLDDIIALPVGPVRPLIWEIENTGETAVDFEVRIASYGSDMMPASSLTSLDGLPPGEPVLRTLSLDPGQSGQVTVEARRLAHDPFRMDDIVLETDLNGDGEPEPLTSLGIRSLPYVPGDMNCDGVINAFDIDPFILALTDPQGYAAAYPGCDADLADINGDGQVNAFDIDPFIDLLTGG